ncbi:MAG: preprotein translocase subunit SecE [Acidobacteria bacterium]|nr:preprotein translocase subunit SecE [Acidobacteriota bacterium]
MTESGHDDDEPEGLEPEPAPGRVSSSDVKSGGAAPRMARYGEGSEGSPARRERGVAGPRDGLLTRAGKFVRDIRSELGRVSWPTTLEVRNTTIITIIAVIFFALYLFAVDRGLALLIEQIQRFVNWLFGAA